MSIPAWSIINWAPAPLELSVFTAKAHRFQHISTTVLGDKRKHYGQVLWGCDFGGRAAGVAFDWAELRSDIVAQANPMGVLSNIVLFDDVGFPQDDQCRLLALQNAIFGWDWQVEVVAALQGAPSPSELKRNDPGRPAWSTDARAGKSSLMGARLN